MNKVVEKWDEILQIVKTEHDLSDVSFNTWLKPLTVYEVVDNVVTIIVPSEQVGLNYISKKYKLPLQVTISEVTGMENCDQVSAASFTMMILVWVMQDSAVLLLLSAVLRNTDLREMQKAWTEVYVMISHFMHLCFPSPVSLLSTAVTRSVR